MSALQVREQARALGIVLSGSGGKLRYEAPAGCLTPELRQALTTHKAAILDILETERLAARRIVRCRDCEHYNPVPAHPSRQRCGLGNARRLRTRPDIAGRQTAHLPLHRLVLRRLDF